MGPNQRPKSRLEGSNHNLDYQTIPERDMLIFKSSGSTRRIQQAQDHQIPISSTTTGFPHSHRLTSYLTTTQGQTLCSRLDILLRARRSAQGQTLCSRPDIMLRARRSAQGQTLCSRSDILLKARRSAQGLTFLLKARHSAEPPPDAGVLLDYRLTPELPSDAGSNFRLQPNG
ncbi:hypothetical protein M5K25_020487 [Dendrobium thyrsiflorum]|uniref:Uncharacterized protein n=1 Tax=Dendrobium thyrsiflorum TaxID=117978 RepID=A0ABD0UA57_DENTH